jgi:hypothetical protein
MGLMSHRSIMTSIRVSSLMLQISKANAQIRGGSRGRTRRAPPKIGKNMIYWGKIVIFHTKYPKNFRASLCSAQFF